MAAGLLSGAMGVFTSYNSFTNQQRDANGNPLDGKPAQINKVNELKNDGRPTSPVIVNSNGLPSSHIMKNFDNVKAADNSTHGLAANHVSSSNISGYGIGDDSVAVKQQYSTAKAVVQTNKSKTSGSTV
ncbi:hypothetical protein [Neisseria arctica]|nr:hypothetical protein [Neisseria arctica]UOO85832.1 hypothetical protein LVJ86_06190 [Neisseria arctica]